MGKLAGLMIATCCAALAIGWAAPRIAARGTPEGGGSVATEKPVASAAVSSSAASIARGPDGHYRAQATVDGRAVTFLVDTGATTVALTQADARRLGLTPERLVYDVPIRTASGEAYAAAVTLGSVSVSGARVENVEALVAEGGLEQSLLGMSYLGRLSRFEATPQALILRR